ncbi:MAG: gluconate 2-dehydrogenase subunit 3 family protein [Xanthomonadales bacterium]|nr:gluconate 2-dehydrogenase subunit 3 family protein [Xanthomonadales bacterium]
MHRRDFLKQGGTALGGSWITLGMPAIMATASVAARAATEKSPFRVLSAQEATEFEAIAARIIPSGDSPGAREGGVIYFIDTVLADIEPAILKPMRKGLLSLQADIRQAYDATSFADLSERRQIEALQSIEDTEFFETLRFLTIAGMFCDPSRGGNRGRVGWKLIGFEGPVGTQPPFGHYDADYAKRGE